jgi:hypothetical protein
MSFGLKKAFRNWAFEQARECGLVHPDRLVRIGKAFGAAKLEKCPFKKNWLEHYKIHGEQFPTFATWKTPTQAERLRPGLAGFQR